MADTPKTPPKAAQLKSTPDLKSKLQNALSSNDPKLETADTSTKAAADTLETVKSESSAMRNQFNDFLQQLSDKAGEIGKGVEQFHSHQFDIKPLSFSPIASFGSSHVEDIRNIPGVDWRGKFLARPFAKTNIPQVDRALTEVQREFLDDINKLQNNTTATFSYYSKQIKDVKQDFATLQEVVDQQGRKYKDLSQKVDKLERQLLFGQQRPQFATMDLDKSQYKDMSLGGGSGSDLTSTIAGMVPGVVEGMLGGALLRALPTALRTLGIAGVGAAAVAGQTQVTRNVDPKSSGNPSRDFMFDIFGGGPFGTSWGKYAGGYDTSRTERGVSAWDQILNSILGEKPGMGGHRSMESLLKSDYGQLLKSRTMQFRKRDHRRLTPRSIPDSVDESSSTNPQQSGDSMSLKPQQRPWYQRGSLNPFNPDNIENTTPQRFGESIIKQSQYQNTLNKHDPGVMSSQAPFSTNVEDRRPPDAIAETQNTEEMFMERTSFQFIATRSDITLSADQGSLVASAREVTVKGEKVIIESAQIEFSSQPRIKSVGQAFQFGAGGGQTNQLSQQQLFGNMGGAGGMSLQPPQFAVGGRPVPGQASIVGERGPELFVPDKPGTVVSNKDSGMGSLEEQREGILSRHRTGAKSPLFLPQQKPTMPFVESIPPSPYKPAFDEKFFGLGDVNRSGADIGGGGGFGGIPGYGGPGDAGDYGPGGGGRYGRSGRDRYGEPNLPSINQSERFERMARGEGFEVPKFTGIEGQGPAPQMPSGQPYGTGNFGPRAEGVPTWKPGDAGPVPFATPSSGPAGFGGSYRDTEHPYSLLTSATGLNRGDVDVLRNLMFQKESGRAGYRADDQGNRSTSNFGFAQYNMEDVHATAAYYKETAPTKQELLNNPTLQEKYYEGYLMSRMHTYSNHPEFAKLKEAAASGDSQARLRMLQVLAGDQVGKARNVLSGDLNPSVEGRNPSLAYWTAPLGNYMKQQAAYQATQGKPQTTTEPGKFAAVPTYGAENLPKGSAGTLPMGQAGERAIPTQTPEAIKYKPTVGPYGPLADQKDRPYYYGGTATVEGSEREYHFGTGGLKRGSAPYGTYPVNVGDYSSIGAIASFGHKGGGGMPDPRYPGEPREGTQIHSAFSDRLDKLMTEGCFSIAKSEYPAFKRDLLALAQKGPVDITLSPGGRATITHAGAEVVKDGKPQGGLGTTGTTKPWEEMPGIPQTPFDKPGQPGQTEQVATRGTGDTNEKPEAMKVTGATKSTTDQDITNVPTPRSRPTDIDGGNIAEAKLGERPSVEIGQPQIVSPTVKGSTTPYKFGPGTEFPEDITKAGVTPFPTDAQMAGGLLSSVPGGQEISRMNWIRGLVSGNRSPEDNIQRGGPAMEAFTQSLHGEPSQNIEDRRNEPPSPPLEGVTVDEQQRQSTPDSRQFFVPPGSQSKAPTAPNYGNAMDPVFNKIPGGDSGFREAFNKMSPTQQANIMKGGSEAIIDEMMKSPEARQRGASRDQIRNWLNNSYSFFGHPGYPGGIAQLDQDLKQAHTKVQAEEKAYKDAQQQAQATPTQPPTQGQAQPPTTQGQTQPSTQGQPRQGPTQGQTQPTGPQPSGPTWPGTTQPRTAPDPNKIAQDWRNTGMSEAEIKEVMGTKYPGSVPQPAQGQATQQQPAQSEQPTEPVPLPREKPMEKMSPRMEAITPESHALSEAGEAASKQTGGGETPEPMQPRSKETGVTPEPDTGHEQAEATPEPMHVEKESTAGSGTGTGKAPAMEESHEDAGPPKQAGEDEPAGKQEHEEAGPPKQADDEDKKDATPVDKDKSDDKKDTSREDTKSDNSGDDPKPDGSGQHGSGHDSTSSHSPDHTGGGGGGGGHRVSNPSNHPESKSPGPEQNGYGDRKHNPDGQSGICMI